MLTSFLLHRWNGHKQGPWAPSRLELPASAKAGELPAIYVAMSFGKTAIVRQQLESAFDPAVVLRPGQRAALASGSFQGATALGRAIGAGHAETAAAYVAAVLGVPTDILSVAAKQNLVSVRGAEHARPALYHALKSHPEVAGALSRALCETPAPGLGSGERAALLLACRLSAPRKPALYGLAADRSVSPRQELAVFDHLRAVLASDFLLPQDKGAICASAYWQHWKRQTAARKALAKGNAGMAGAMVCAVVEGAKPECMAELLGGMGVSVAEVLQALMRSGLTANGWAERIAARATPAQRSLPGFTG